MEKQHEDSEFIMHTPCPECGSSDANGLYDDGHQYCFACRHHTPASESEEGTIPVKQAAVSTPAQFLTPAYISLGKRGGLGVDTCKKYDYGCAKMFDRNVHVATYCDAKGNKVAQHIRYLDDKDFIWIGEAKKAALYGQQRFGTGGKRIVVTEGELDCLTISQVFKNKWPVVSIPSGISGARKALERSLEWLESYDEIVLAFDDDEPGRQGVEECADLFTPGKVKVMQYNGCKDANQMLMEGKFADIAPCVFNAEAYRPDGIISMGSLRKQILEAPEYGLAIPYPRLSEKLQGLRKRELLLFTAGSGIGKSTLVHELGYYLRMSLGQNLGIMALEESPKRLSWRYVGIHLNSPIHLREGWERSTDKDKLAAFDALRPDDGFYIYDHFGSSQIDNLIAKLRYMAVGLKVDWIIIDHISIVVSGLDEIGESERKTIDKLMTKLRSLIEETGVGVMAIVHLKRPYKGKSYNEGRQVSLTDLRGSGALEQLSDAVIAMERDQQDEDHPNMGRIRLLKCRYTGYTGECDAIKYYPETGRLLECNSEAEGFATGGGGDPDVRDEFQDF